MIRGEAAEKGEKRREGGEETRSSER